MPWRYIIKIYQFNKRGEYMMKYSFLPNINKTKILDNIGININILCRPTKDSYNKTIEQLKGE